MINIDFKALGRTIGNAIKKNSPKILTAVVIAGNAMSVVLAVKATPKAMAIIEERKNALKKDKLTPKETVEAVWKCYVPSAITGAASAACLLASNSIMGRRTAALATAYSISEQALSTYKDKVVEVVGEKKEEAVRDAVARDAIAGNPIGNREIIVTGKGSSIFYDTLSGRYFYSDMDTMKRVELEIKRRLLDEMYISLNEFYDEIHLSEIDMGRDVGWRVEDGIDLCFSAQLMDDGTPCVVVNYLIAPEYGFDKLI